MLPALRARRADRDGQAERPRRLARREVADEDPLVDELRAHAGHAVVIPTERPHPARQGRVSGHRDVGGSVAKLSARLRPHEGGPGECDLVFEEPIGLGGMAARLMHQQREELRSEYERRRTLGREWRVQRRLGIVAVARRSRDQIEMLDVLPSRLSHQTRVVAARRLTTCFHREN